MTPWWTLRDKLVVKNDKIIKWIDLLHGVVSTEPTQCCEVLDGACQEWFWFQTSWNLEPFIFDNNSIARLMVYWGHSWIMKIKPHQESYRKMPFYLFTVSGEPAASFPGMVWRKENTDFKRTGLFFLIPTWIIIWPNKRFFSPYGSCFSQWDSDDHPIYI